MRVVLSKPSTTSMATGQYRRSQRGCRWLCLEWAVFGEQKGGSGSRRASTPPRWATPEASPRTPPMKRPAQRQGCVECRGQHRVCQGAVHLLVLKPLTATTAGAAGHCALNPTSQIHIYRRISNSSPRALKMYHSDPHIILSCLRHELDLRSLLRQTDSQADRQNLHSI
ncbi:mitochondrial peptide methionine sulfoxide reductase isoform X2 [Esox lucius]|uniref:mitochondrial peptide methionine sulfoxide reductase isoform X2 n=1 Tax=Esox lucius TaxID=8010 RepID=UPI0014777613|nr:mitochondrial peptide methionine sulfoxide reductase isoform X2 [Esox lucius]XP_034143674.1 mitochondrial peptide methionine sulfoxide reductase isoform X2 [Esox lucius]